MYKSKQVFSLYCITYLNIQELVVE